jgi:protein required for attachment to host cells
LQEWVQISRQRAARFRARKGRCARRKACVSSRTLTTGAEHFTTPFRWFAPCIARKPENRAMKTCVLVADRARARLFVSAPSPERAGVSSRGEELVEIESLTDPDGELTGKQLFSSTRSGSNRSPHGATFEYDDRRQGHRDEEERRFAKRIAEAVRRRVEAERPNKLILAVEPQLLGMLRQALNGGVQSSLEVVELAKDFSWHSPQHVQAALERCGALTKIKAH